jgi:hypothetical protein
VVGLGSIQKTMKNGKFLTNFFKLRKVLKVIAIELLITTIQLVTFVRTFFIQIKDENKIFLSVGIGFSILYMLYRIGSKIKEENDRIRVNEIVALKMGQAANTFLYVLDLILINHPEGFILSDRDKSKYKIEKNARKLFEVDFRIPDPYTGTSMGNLAEQVDFQMNREYVQLEKTISRYASKINIRKLDLFEAITNNRIFKSLVDCKLWYSQLESFNDYAAKHNITYPKSGRPITISLDFNMHQKDYNEMIDLLFELKECHKK